MDTQNDGLEKVDSFKIWPFSVFMLDFWGVLSHDPSLDVFFRMAFPCNSSHQRKKTTPSSGWMQLDL